MSSSSRCLTDTHGLLLMSLDQQTAGYKDHDYPVPKLIARAAGFLRAPIDVIHG
jgi:hypothetical protein